MNIANLKAEVAVDLIGLINELKGFKFDCKVEYNTKSGKKEFEYVTLNAILDRVKENTNFAILMPLGTNEYGQPALQIILVHKSGYVMISDYYVLRVSENVSKQDEGAAITYTKRYALGAFLGLCTDMDNDANPDGNGQGAKTPRQTEQKNLGNESDKIAREILHLGKKLGKTSWKQIAEEFNIMSNTSIERMNNIRDELTRQLKEMEE